MLAALQALVLYIIIRLDEGETEFNNADTLLVNTVTVGATRWSSLSAEL